MNETEVKIQIKGTQKYVDNPGENDMVVTSAKGKYYLKNESIYIVYEEYDKELNQSTQSMLKIKENSVDLIRKGSINTKLSFKKDMKYASTYTTPFGVVLMAVETSGLTILRSEKQMTILIEYKTEMDDKYIADNKLNIVIRSNESLFI